MILICIYKALHILPSHNKYSNIYNYKYWLKTEYFSLV